MDIRVLTYGYNEIKMLPLKLAWCKYHNLQMVYFDNESTDGSREWAIENGVFAGDIVTNGEFNITKTMEVLEEYRKENEYDWSIIAGVDLFFHDSYYSRIEEVVKYADLNAKDGIKTNYRMICRTDDKSTLDFSYYDRYNIERDDLILMAHHSRSLHVDAISSDDPFEVDTGCWFNFGHTKSKEERMETFERRQKAWKNGENKGYGNHYRMLAQTGFTVPMEHTRPISTNKHVKESYEGLCEILENLVY